MSERCPHDPVIPWRISSCIGCILRQTEALEAALAERTRERDEARAANGHDHIDDPREGCALCDLIDERTEASRREEQDRAAIREAARIIPKTASMKMPNVWWHETHAAAIQRASQDPT